MLPRRLLQVVFVLLRGVLAGFRSRRDVALENPVSPPPAPGRAPNQPHSPTEEAGSRSLGLAPAALACLARAPPHRQARDGCPLAPKGLAHLLELEGRAVLGGLDHVYARAG